MVSRSKREVPKPSTSSPDAEQAKLLGTIVTNICPGKERTLPLNAHQQQQNRCKPQVLEPLPHRHPSVNINVRDCGRQLPVVPHLGQTCAKPAQRLPRKLEVSAVNTFLRLEPAKSQVTSLLGCRLPIRQGRSPLKASPVLSASMIVGGGLSKKERTRGPNHACM